MGTWHTLGAHGRVDVALLLTDGAIMAFATKQNRYRLIRPGKGGDYVAAKTTTKNDLPAPVDGRSAAVMTDGRVFELGGEETHVYDPVEAKWTAVSGAASGWKTGLTVLADGCVMLENELPPCTVSLRKPDGVWERSPGLPDYPNGGPRVLLRDGRLFALTKSHVHLFVPDEGKWKKLGDGPKLPSAAPALLLPDERVLLVDTKTPRVHYFTPPKDGASSGSWSAGPKFPPKDARGWALKAATGALCLLPSGKVLCGAEYWGTGGIGNQALVMYEFDPETESFVAQPNDEFVRKAQTGYFEMPRAVTLLLLPTGQVFVNLVVDPTLSKTIAKDFLYTPSDAPNLGWAPKFECPAKIRAGRSFALEGRRLNGYSQGVSRMAPGGEDALLTGKPTTFATQGATNYPLVELARGGTVRYLRTSDFSSMGVATGRTTVSARCHVPADAPLGAAKLRVVTNGIPSAWRDVVVLAALKKPDIIDVRLLGPAAPRAALRRKAKRR